MVDLLQTGQRTRIIHGLLEIDITTALEQIRKRQRELRRGVSLTAFLIYCLGQAVGRHKQVHAYRKGRKKLVIFDEVDVNTMLEKRKPDGVIVPVGYIFRAANRKTLAQVNHEMRQALKSDLLNDRNVRRRARLTRLPALVRRLIWRRIERDPALHKEHRGTVGLTNVGHYAPGRAGWAVPITPLACTVAVGGTCDRVCLRDGVPENRRFLCVTFSFNHDVVDGAPAARFTEDFARLVETASGLDDAFVSESRDLFGKSRG